MERPGDEPTTPVPTATTTKTGERPAATAPRDNRWSPAIIILGIAAVAYVIYKLPPYLSLDPANSRIPPEHPLHFALLSGHVLAGSIALLTPVIQFWPWLRRKYPTLHRISGRIYVFAGALPSAVLAISMYPVTHGPGRVAVLAASILWTYTALLGLLTARRKQYAAHRRWMVYSYAIMWGYGVWVFVYANLFVTLGISIPTAVEAARWGGWTSNLLIAHWWLERTAGRTIAGGVKRRTPKKSPSTTPQPTAHSTPAPAAP
ncbi:DUF2306 domain-containing protein [Actinosynnema sp. NPDC020468]|uniref:DUF2306 domain-containing protein n=1 Tax=Actinosynnema sp. NPDC020468 TaxID=3154488 RepID=UPI0033F9C485